MSETHLGRVGVDVSLAARRARGAYPRGGARFVTGVVMVFAVATATFGVQAYVRAGHEQARVAALEADVSALQQRLAGDEHVAASERRHVRSVAAQATSARRAVARFSWALQSVPSEAEVAGVRNELAAYAACIPQLQSEIAGLGISWRIDPRKPATDYFKLSTAAPITTPCARALAGH